MASGFEGRLGQRFIPDLLRDIAFRKLTGVLRLSRDDITRSIAFESGEPINAFSSIPSEQLDARLIRDGHTTAGLVCAAKGSQPDPALLGSALVEHGIVSEEVMKQTASELAAQIVLSLFEWTDAEYQLEETEQSPCARVFQTTTAELVIEGTRQAASSDAFVDRVAPSGRSVMQSQTAGDHLAASAKLNSTEGYIFSLANSPTRLSEIRKLSGLSDEQIRQAVCVLLALGMLTTVSQADDPQPDPVIAGILRKLLLFETANYYEILGVDRLATTAAINRAYEQLEEMFQSHRADYSDRADVQRQIEELFGKIQTAHQTLRDPLKRREYDRPPDSAPLRASSYPPLPGNASRRSGGKRDDSSFSEHSTHPNTSAATSRPALDEPIIERGQASDSPGRKAKLPPRKPIPIPEIQMPVAPRKDTNAKIERGQRDGSRPVPTPSRRAAPVTRPPAVLSPEEVWRLEQGGNNEEKALHFYRQGRMRYERRELEAATHLFREAVRLDSTQSQYHFYLAVALSIQAHARHEHLHHEGCHVTCQFGGTLVRNPRVRYEAEQHFLRAAELNPSNAQIALKLGQLYKEAGLLKKAEHYLTLTLTLDSKNQLAKHELETLHKSQEEDEVEDEDVDVEVT